MYFRSKERQVNLVLQMGLQISYFVGFYSASGSEIYRTKEHTFTT